MSQTGTVHVMVIAAVFDRSGSLLLVQKRDDGAWGCPQGWLRPGETLREAAKRKVSEEAGVLVSVERLLATRSVLVSQDPPEGDLQMLFECHPLAGAPRPGVFELAAEYHAFDALPELRDGQQAWIAESMGEDDQVLE